MWSLLLPGALLATLVLWVYYPAIGGDYLWDDDVYVSENVNLRDWNGLRQIWTAPSSSPQYYPLVFTSFWIERRLFGTSPAAHHVVNILLHFGCALIVWRLLRRLGVPGAYVAGVVFAVHPVHVESVAWITERKNVLSAAFYLASLWSYLQFFVPAGVKDGVAPTAVGNRPSATRWYWASLWLFACALLSKTVTATLPVTIVAAILWKHGRVAVRDLAPLLPFVALGVLMGGVTAWLEVHHVGAAGDEWDLRWVEHALLAARIFWFYLGKIFWPHPLMFVYPRWQVSGSDPTQYVFLLALVALAVTFIALRRRLGIGPLASLLFFGASLFPAMGFFDVYPMRFSYVADHFQYLATIGPIALAVGCAASGLRRLGRTGLTVTIGALVVAALATTARGETKKYDSIESLWLDTVAKNQDAWIAHNNLGNLRLREGRYADARAHFRTTVRLRPKLAEARNNLGAAEYALGNAREAIQQIRTAVELDPGYAEAWNNLGVALAAEHRYDVAIDAYTRALATSPAYATAHFNLGNAFLRAERVKEAEAEYREAIRLNPGLAMAHFSLGLSLLSGGNASEAAPHLDAAFRLRPDFAIGYFQVGNVELRQGRPADAVTSYGRAIAAKSDYPEAYCNRGTALMQLGRLEDAIKDFREATRLRPGYTLADASLRHALDLAKR